MDSRACIAKPGKRFRLKDHDPGDTGPYKDSVEVEGHLERGLQKLVKLQDMLYAQNCWSLLLIFQAMDAAGKDSTIKHITSGLNALGCQAYSFKQPSSEELDHDFLWRANLRLPARGRIGLFNRSYYEEVLVLRVHPEILQAERLPTQLVTKKIWPERYEDINAFERYQARNGLVICKFFLNVSKKMQARRMLERLESPDKNWKFRAADLNERELWPEYMKAYEQMIDATSTPWAPWYVVPADHKWYTRLVVADAVIDALEKLKLTYPKVVGEQKKEIEMLKRKIRISGAAGLRVPGHRTKKDRG